MTMVKSPKESLIVNTDQVMINDLNNYNTLFGGVLMKKLDNNATLSARRHARVKECVTASTDSIDFLYPITQSDSVCVESFVSYTGDKSMEIFCKVIAEDMISGERRMAATAFLTFVALDDRKKPVKVPEVLPETEEEKFLYESGKERAETRRIRRKHSKELTKMIELEKPWEKGEMEHDCYVSGVK
ncbi:acyl-CoA thioesterase [Halobacillus sp. A5]|uniref:acyl-CoA thioesterase n=1 Tax=Halobacillus sp. A5 TaxID=2880263 RepID=UPI0020A67ED2|nr:acyl-CoA thioesterase [Halobacillus sp. A5]MCP3028121.1 acyl-CoA thioesterase [Halobacillus sp. A5]